VIESGSLDAKEVQEEGISLSIIGFTCTYAGAMPSLTYLVTGHLTVESMIALFPSSSLARLKRRASRAKCSRLESQLKWNQARHSPTHRRAFWPAFAPT